MLNNYPYYRYKNPYNRFNRFNPAFFTQHNYNPNLTNIQNNYEETKEREIKPKHEIDNENNEFFLSNESINTNDSVSFQENDNDKSKFRFGPLEISNDRLSLFGFSIAFDDLLIIGLIFILLLDSDCDYALIIVLGLILFNISFSDLNFFKLL